MRSFLRAADWIAGQARNPVLPLLLGLAAVDTIAAMPDWRTVPGSDQVEVAVDSLDMQGSRVAACDLARERR